MCRFIEQFRSESMDQGRTDEQKRIAENMLAQGCQDTFILTVTGITQERLDTIKKGIQKQE